MSPTTTTGSNVAAADWRRSGQSELDPIQALAARDRGVAASLHVDTCSATLRAGVNASPRFSD